jgi:hypothetical protein
MFAAAAGGHLKASMSGRTAPPPGRLAQMAFDCGHHRSEGVPMSDSIPTEGEKLGTDGTIPNSEDGIALGHGAASHFNEEEDEQADSGADSAAKDLEDPAQN